jgi:hypothetical protein
MKKRILPIGLFSFLFFVLSAFLVVPGINDEGNPENTFAKQTIQNAKDYLAKIRNNQHTGILNPADVIQARQQAKARANYKSGNSANDLDWIEMGPDNIAGRVRTVIFDNRDASANTLYAGGVSGGMFKSTNLGSTWAPVNQSGQNLNVSCMVQDAAGTIYVGTGEGLNTQIYSGFGTPGYGYSGGFVGQGIFKSDGNDNFNLVPGTEPVINGDTIEWAYINKLALDVQGNRLFAATHLGLNYANLPDLNNWQSDCKYQLDSTIFTRHITSDSIITCDSFEIVNGEYIIYGETQMVYEILGDDTTNTNVVYSEFVPFEVQGNCYDVKVSSQGWIITTFNGFIYVSATGDPQKFVNRSIYPNNQDSKRKDMIDFSTHVVIKNKSGAVLHDVNTEYSKEFDWHVNYILLDDLTTDLDEYPSSANTGRVSFAISPSDQNIVYLMATKSSNPFANSMFNIYISENKGQSWRIIAPGGTNQLNILGYYWASDAGVLTYYYQGDYNNTLAVHPDNPYKIIAGGVNMWEGLKVSETGYFQWTEKSIGDATLIFNGIFNNLYCHTNHHQYAFRPGFNNQLVVATDGGIYFAEYDGNLYYFQSRNKNLNVTQFYTLGVTGEVAEAMGGTQDNGTQYISGKGNTPKKGEDLWRPANLDPKYPEGTDGGGVAISSMRSYNETGGEVVEEKDPPSFYSKGTWPKNEALNLRIRRSESLGFDYSANLFASGDADPVNTNFLTPVALWESYENTNSRDSVTFNADRDYSAGEFVIVRSKNLNHPFSYELPASISSGDSMRVQDIISTKFFIATKDNIWMTLDGIRFNVDPDWFKISDKVHAGFKDNPSCIAYSTDGNYVFIGNYEGKIYRLSNIALAFNEELADVSSAECIIATTELIVYEGNTQAITSISVDPKHPNRVLVTLGNYGNTDYVYYSTNALSDTPVFNSVQGDGETGLPAMPVYSSVLEMQPDSDIALVGTEAGIWMSDNVGTGVWYQASSGMGEVPVMMLKQQTNYKGSFTITTFDPVTNEPFSEVFTQIKNYGMIYAASHGRGIFRAENYFTVGEEEFTENPESGDANLTIFPNPASDKINVLFDLSNSSDVQLNVFDLGGKLMYSKNLSNLGKGTQKVDVNVNSLARGTYLLQVISEKNTSTAKLVIVR